MVNEAYLLGNGFKFVKEASHPFHEYYKKGRIAVDLKEKKLFLMRYKAEQNHAELHLPDDTHKFDETVMVLLNN